MDEKTREQRIRRALKDAGYTLHKSRAQQITANNMGDYMVVDLDTTAAVVGQNFNATLDEIEDWMQSMEILGE